MDSDTNYTATLTLTSTGLDGEMVDFNLVFSHDRVELGEKQPVAYKVMDFINDTAILPIISIAQQFEGIEMEGNSESVN